jgi:predicted transcriptional regulator
MDLSKLFYEYRTRDLGRRWLVVWGCFSATVLTGLSALTAQSSTVDCFEQLSPATTARLVATSQRSRSAIESVALLDIQLDFIKTFLIESPLAYEPFLYGPLPDSPHLLRAALQSHLSDEKANSRSVAEFATTHKISEDLAARAISVIERVRARPEALDLIAQLDQPLGPDFRRTLRFRRAEQWARDRLVARQTTLDPAAFDESGVAYPNLTLSIPLFLLGNNLPALAPSLGPTGLAIGQVGTIVAIGLSGVAVQHIPALWRQVGHKVPGGRIAVEVTKRVRSWQERSANRRFQLAADGLPSHEFDYVFEQNWTDWLSLLSQHDKRSDHASLELPELSQRLAGLASVLNSTMHWQLPNGEAFARLAPQTSERSETQLQEIKEGLQRKAAQLDLIDLEILVISSSLQARLSSAASNSEIEIAAATLNSALPLLLQQTANRRLYIEQFSSRLGSRDDLQALSRVLDSGFVSRLRSRLN